MKLIIDTDDQEIRVDEDGEMKTLPLYSKKGFELISRAWLKIGWNEKHVYTFTWFGRPIIQLPEDIVRMQEVIYSLKPDVIVETGVAHGGSLIFYASLFKALGSGRVIGIDIDIRPHNRKGIEEHEFFPIIELIEGSSTSPEVVSRVKSLIKPDESVLVVLDSNHTYEHVMGELEAYNDLVSQNSYIVATDGIMREVHDTPMAGKQWLTDNPANAAEDFAKTHPEFEIEQPKWKFNESELDKNITHFPSAWLKRI